MKVTIRLSTELSYSVNIPDGCTVDQLKELARDQSPDSSKLPLDFKLIHNGEKLAPGSSKVSELTSGNTSSELTVILMSETSDISELSTGTAGSSASSNLVVTAKKRKVRCSFKACKAVPLRNVGSCSYCSGKFCAKHRLLEDHLCQGLQYCKDNAHEKNAMKLQSESTIASRV